MIGNDRKNIDVKVFLLGIITLIIVCAVLKFMSSFFIPFAIAIFLAFIFKPLIEFLQKKWKFPSILAILVSVLLLVLMLFLFTLFVTNTLSTFANEYPKYQQKFSETYSTMSENMNNSLGSVFAKFNIDNKNYDIASFTKGIKWSKHIGAWMKTISGGAFTFASKIGLIFLLILFLFVEFTSLEEKIYKCLGKEKIKDEVNGDKDDIFDEISSDVVGYLRTKFILSLITGLCIYIAVKIIGLDFPVLWAFLAFVLNFIPTIGSILFVVLVSMMGFAQFFPSWGPILAVIISSLLIEMIIGNFIDPMVQGNRFELSPFVVLFALLFWGWMWGPVGMFLSVPIVMTIKIICEKIPSLQFISIMIGKGGTSSSIEKKKVPIRIKIMNSIKARKSNKSKKQVSKNE